MAKPDEVGKAAARGQEMSAAEAALEGARDAFHASGKNQADVDAFQAAQRAVVDERVANRHDREAAGPPVDASDIQRDVMGRIFGWTTAAGDVVSSPGGVEG